MSEYLIDCEKMDCFAWSTGINNNLCTRYHFSGLFAEFIGIRETYSEAITDIMTNIRVIGTHATDTNTHVFNIHVTDILRNVEVENNKLNSYKNNEYYVICIDMI